MNISVDIKRIDLIRFRLMALPTLKSTYITPIAGSIFIFAILMFEKKGIASPDNLLMLAGQSVGLGILCMLFGIAFSIISIFFNSTKMNGILGNHEFQINSSGLHIKTPVNEVLHTWNNIKEVKIIGSYIFIYLGWFQLFYIIPSYAFDSPDNFDKFVKLAATHIKNAHNRNHSE